MVDYICSISRYISQSVLSRTFNLESAAVHLPSRGKRGRWKAERPSTTTSASSADGDLRINDTQVEGFEVVGCLIGSIPYTYV